jgi:hypothetical protein
MSSGHFLKHITIVDMVTGHLASAQNIFLLVSTYTGIEGAAE